MTGLAGQYMRDGGSAIRFRSDLCGGLCAQVASFDRRAEWLSNRV